MHTHTDRTPDQVQSVTGPVSRKQGPGTSAFQSTDNQPGAIAQRKQQELANRSPRVQQLKAYQAMVNHAFAGDMQPVQRKPNDTGLSDGLKSGIETLSGYSMDDVKVHYNSGKAAQLNAHAYAQGTDIHLGPGQEEHLPHEAWHVVQQKQGRVQPTLQTKGGVPINDDTGLEHEADVMGATAMQMKSGPGLPGIRTANITGNLVQRVERKATVRWGITHLVKVQNPGTPAESLFGDNWQVGEVSTDWGQLSQGQLIKVEDAAVFMSRRGPNQETRREEDEKTGELRYKWYRVVEVMVNGKFERVPNDDTYVRAETVELEHVPGPKKKIGVKEAEDQDRVTEELEKIQTAWDTADSNRRRSIGQVRNNFIGNKIDDDSAISSGWNWDQYDEGKDVLENMMNPDYRTGWSSDDTDLEKQYTIRASYDAEEQSEPIAFMVLEVRQDVRKDENEKKKVGDPYMYIRWLIGHPEKKGGGAALMKAAKDCFDKHPECKVMIVESALSAVSWYEAMGFKKADETKNVVVKGKGSGDTRLVYTRPA